jgi:hypothetical protein
MVRAKEDNHEEKDDRGAAPDLHADGCDGRECKRTYGGRVDDTVADRADRAWVGCLSLVLRIEVVLHRRSMRCELRCGVRSNLLS